MIASRSRTSYITVPRSKAQVYLYLQLILQNRCETTQVFRLSLPKLFKLVFEVILRTATSPFQHLRTACCLSIQDENLFQDDEVIWRRKCVITYNSCNGCSKSKLSSSEWPVYSSKILEQTMYLSYTFLYDLAYCLTNN
jgi:hypothetical protein